MTLQIHSGALLIDSGQLANDPACCCGGTCCDNAYTSVDVTVGISGAGDCCSEADTLFSGSSTLSSVSTCAFGSSTSGTSSACGASGIYKLVGMNLTVALEDGVSPGSPYSSSAKITAALALRYQLAGASPGDVHLRIYRFERLSCDAGAMSFIDSVVEMEAGSGGGPTFTPAACTVTLDIDALNT